MASRLAALLLAGLLAHCAESPPAAPTPIEPPPGPVELLPNGCPAVPPVPRYTVDREYDGRNWAVHVPRPESVVGCGELYVDLQWHRDDGRWRTHTGNAWLGGDPRVGFILPLFAADNPHVVRMRLCYHAEALGGIMPDRHTCSAWTVEERLRGA